jgi:glycerate dehydrogenase
MHETQAVFLDLATVDCGDVDLTPLESAITGWQYHAATSPQETLQRIRGAELVVSNKVILDRAILQQTPELKLICIAATGTNNVDLEAARELGIAVTNVAGYSTPSVVQQVFGLILGLTNRLPEYRSLVSAGAWPQSSMFCLLDHPFRELNGKLLGIVGYGALGRSVARVAEAFGMEVILAQRPGGPEREGRMPLDELLRRSDVVSLHCPLTEQTRDLIGAQELALMKPDALLINTARGGIVDEAALAKALQEERIGGAGVDVLAEEPPATDNPLLGLDLPNLIVTPHIAWASRESRQRLLDEIAANIRAFHSGERRNRVV